jgi:hypothetical protein
MANREAQHDMEFEALQVDAKPPGRHTLTAIVTGREYSASAAHRYILTHTIHARWGGEGIERTDTFTWHRSVEAGDQIDIWVDTHGNRVDPPRPPHRRRLMSDTHREALRPSHRR